MNSPSIDEEIFESLRSTFFIEKALSQYLNSACVLIESQIKMEHDESIGRTVYSILNHVNELQRIIYLKINIFADLFSESENFSVFREYYEDLNKDYFLDSINLLYSFSSKCLLSEWKRSEIIKELNQAFSIYNKRKNFLKTYRTNKNEPKTVWLDSGAYRPNS
jgi:hypothetical protein